jgi:hypothetical protein
MTDYMLFAGVKPTASVEIPGEPQPIVLSLKPHRSKSGRLSAAGKVEVLVLVNGKRYRCSLTCTLTGLSSETWPGGPKEAKWARQS